MPVVPHEVVTPSTEVVPFRFRRSGPDVLLTSALGDWVFVTPAELMTIARGTLDTELRAKLREKNFLRGAIDQEARIAQLAENKRFLSYGPNLHIVVVTLRCNETCVYCHASRADMTATHTDMTPELAEKTVDFILQSTSPSVTIEFQGGEPLVNFPVVKHLIEYALEKNRAYGKDLEFTMVSNLAMMDEDKLAYLLEKKVQICTSIDGPEPIHTKQRVLVGQSSYRMATKWIQRINEAYEKMGLDTTLYHVEALLTTTRQALDHPKEIVDTYVSLGCRAIFLRPVDPFGFADKTTKTVEYDRARYHEFYRTAVDHIIELNKQGVQVLERYAAIFLTKILAGSEPNFLDIRSPSGSGIGALAYNYDGRIFTSDEGRMMYEMGDGSFEIGHVTKTRYRDAMKHETVRALVMASLRDVQPGCASCTFTPYCGIQPEHSHLSQGTLFGRMPESSLCNVHKGIQDYLFEKLRTGDAETREILKRWTTVRERTHFQQASAAS